MSRSTNSKHSATLLALILSLILMACRPVLETGSGRQALIVALDVSNSTSGIIVDPCARAIGLIASSIPAGAGADVLILATGDSEPQTLVPWVRLESGEIFQNEGDSAARRVEELRRLYETCRARIRSKPSSPVYRAIFRALEATAGRTRSRVLVATDGRDWDAARNPELPRLNNSEVASVAICGLSESGESETFPIPATQLADFWRGLFSNPEKVSITPTCPELVPSGAGGHS